MIIPPGLEFMSSLLSVERPRQPVWELFWYVDDCVFCYSGYDMRVALLLNSEVGEQLEGGGARGMCINCVCDPSLRPQLKPQDLLTTPFSTG